MLANLLAAAGIPFSTINKGVLAAIVTALPPSSAIAFSSMICPPPAEVPRSKSISSPYAPAVTRLPAAIIIIFLIDVPAGCVKLTS
jgi:hypothetical protein